MPSSCMLLGLWEAYGAHNFYQLTLTSVMSPCVMSLPLLCPEILRNRFAQYKALSLSLITFGPKAWYSEQEKWYVLQLWYNFHFNKGRRLNFIQNVVSRPWSPPMGLNQTWYKTNASLVLWSYLRSTPSIPNCLTYPLEIYVLGQSFGT